VAILFFQAAFAGSIPQDTLWQMIWAGLAIKLVVGVLEVPFLYWSYRFLPKRERYYKISIYEGKSSILTIWEDIKDRFAVDASGEILLSGLDDRIWIQMYSKELKDHLEWRKQNNIKTRCLIAESDELLTLDPSSYRGVPKALLASTPFYVYKDSVALINWQDPITVVHIINKDVAETFRRQFELSWNSGTAIDNQLVPITL
jgi:hypothetical protein